MIRFHNTLTRRQEEFRPLVAGQVGLYTCGPTVYADPHIGNLRTFVWEDLLCRFLEARGLAVRQVMNITDVDDKIIERARRDHATLEACTAPFTAAFFEDVEALGMRRAAVYPRATAHVPEMVALIETLMSSGHAYATDGSVYFRIGRFAPYGRLSGKDLAGLRAGASGRVDADEYDKDDVRDFVLWKGSRPGEPSWDGPSGPGRPGWHIECSAMSMKYLGPSFDIHAGGVDNIFPHHENEIAQSEAATGRPLAHTWLHAAHLIVNGEKMSKSKGNVVTLRDLLARGHAARTLRYLLLAPHYRHTLDLTPATLEAASGALDRLDELGRRLEGEPEPAAGIPPSRAGEPGRTDLLATRVASAATRFHAALDDDLNTSAALGALFEMVREVNTGLDAGQADAGARRAARQLLGDFEAVFGIRLQAGEETLPAELAALVAEREEARRRRDWATSDRLRQRLLEAGVGVEDTPRGQRWKRQGRS